MVIMGKITKEDLAKLTNLDDNTRADLAARFDEIDDLNKKLADVTKQKGDADVIAARAGTAEKALKERDAKIVELEGLLAKHTGKEPDEITLEAFKPFFDFWN